MAEDMLRARLIAALEEKSADHGIDIVDVQIAGAFKLPVLDIRIDHADEDMPAITLDEIAAQNGWIGACIDEMDPFPGAYTLEVSSPGMARPLRKARDFERFAGSTVVLRTNGFSGRRTYTGALEGIEGTTVSLACDDGAFSFDLADIKSCTIKPVYDFSAASDTRG
ncbi:ribosome maturation factor RimP [Coriobacteriales bacterium OH1046]|nr:ribosome maturation factor RimP [Coriobacteriales bacterium OH1046]